MVRIKRAPLAKSQSQLVVLVGTENTSFVLISDYPVQKIVWTKACFLNGKTWLCIYLFV